MRTRIVVALNVGVAAVLILALSSPWASGATTHYLTLQVGSFIRHDSTDRNNTNTPACGAAVGSEDGTVFKGRLQQAEGGFVQSVNVPNGATITRLNLFARDPDTDAGIDVHAYLFRKRIADGLSPDTRGFTEMAHAQSTGGAAEMRRFSDTSIANAIVDNARFAYYAELDVCFLTLEPHAVQVVYTTP